MLSQGLQDRFSKIAAEARLMVDSCVEKIDLTGKVNYVSIFAKSESDFLDISKEISINGKVFDQQETGNYYLLDKPLNAPTGIIDVCRIRSFDKEHGEEGYLDFEVVNYQKFKEKYLSKNNFLVLDLPHVQLVELRDPMFNVRAYFPNGF